MSQSLKRTDHNALINRNTENQHNIGAIEGLQEALDNKVPTERKINGQTLENDVDIKNVESADKLKTARNINGVAFDGTKDIKVYSENELPRQRFVCNSKRWVRFAKISALPVSATIRISREYAHGDPEAYSINFNGTYAQCGFVQTSSLFSLSARYITKVRAVYLRSDVYLEFYYNSTAPNHVTTNISNINSAYPDVLVENIHSEDCEIPEGFSVLEFDLSESPIKTDSLQIGNTTLTETQLQALLKLI